MSHRNAPLSELVRCLARCVIDDGCPLRRAADGSRSHRPPQLAGLAAIETPKDTSRPGNTTPTATRSAATTTSTPHRMTTRGWPTPNYSPMNAKTPPPSSGPAPTLGSPGTAWPIEKY